MAEPRARTGRQVLLPMRTLKLEVEVQEMKADLSGNIWSVAPESATARRPDEVGAIEDVDSHDRRD